MFGVATSEVSGRVVPRKYVKVFMSLLRLDIKDVAPKLKPPKKLIFVWVHSGVFKGWSPQIMSK